MIKSVLPKNDFSDSVVYFPCKSESLNVGTCERPALFFIHGWGSHSGIWQPLISLLNEHYAIYTIDLPGCGASAEIEWPEFDRLKQTIHNMLPPKVVLIGWSLGGMLASAITADSSEKIMGLVTLGANPKFVASASWPQAMNKTVFNEFVSGFKRYPEETYLKFLMLQCQGHKNTGVTSAASNHRKKIQLALQKIQPSITSDLECASTGVAQSWLHGLRLLDEINNVENFNKIAQPVLHVFGRNDTLVPVAAAMELQRQTDHHVRILDDVGHVIPLADPEGLAADIKSFIALHVDHKTVDDAEKNHRKKQAVAESFSRAANTYDQVAGLQRRIALKLIEKKSLYAGTLLDLGCGTGFCSQYLIERVNYDCESLFAMDLSQGMLCVAKEKFRQLNISSVHWLCADMEKLPLASGVLDGVISSLCIQWSENEHDLFSEIERSLKPGGWCLVSTLGPQTLNELRSAWQSVNDFVHVNRFLGVEELNDAIARAGLVIDSFSAEIEILEYDKVSELMRELKALGAHNVNAGRKSGLTTRKELQALQYRYDDFKNSSGKLPATYDVFFFLLRKPA